MDGARDIGEVQGVITTSKGVDRPYATEVLEVSERIVVWQGMEEAQLLKLVLGEVGQRRFLKGTESTVLGYKESKAFVCVVGLILESFKHFSGFQVV